VAVPSRLSELAERSGDETVGRVGGNLDRPQVGADEDRLQLFTKGKHGSGAIECSGREPEDAERKI
jgi:hypothetical protein